MKTDSPWRNKTLLTICVGQVLLMIGMGFLSPILPKFVQVLGVAPTQIGTMVGLVISVYGVGRAAMCLPTGRLAQRWGRRPLLILGPAFVAISTLGMGLSTAYWQLVMLQLFHGLAATVFSVSAMIVTGEISTPANRGQYMSLYFGSLFIGASLGPALGGFVGQYLGYRAPFFCFAGLASAAALWNYLRIPETKTRQLPAIFETPDDPKTQNSAKQQIPLYRNLSFVLISVITLVTLITLTGNQITLIPLLGYERLNLEEGQVGLTLGLVAALQAAFVFLAGRLSDKLGRKTIIIPGGIVTALGLALFTQSGSYRSFLLSAAVLGLGRGFGSAVPSAYVADIASPRDYEHTMALYRTAGDTGGVIGPLLLGWLKDVIGLDFPFFLGAGLLFVTVILFAAFAQETVGRGASQ